MRYYSDTASERLKILLITEPSQTFIPVGSRIRDQGSDFDNFSAAGNRQPLLVFISSWSHELDLSVLVSSIFEHVHRTSPHSDIVASFQSEMLAAISDLATQIQLGEAGEAIGVKIFHTGKVLRRALQLRKGMPSPFCQVPRSGRGVECCENMPVVAVVLETNKHVVFPAQLQKRLARMPQAESFAASIDIELGHGGKHG